MWYNISAQIIIAFSSTINYQKRNQAVCYNSYKNKNLKHKYKQDEIKHIKQYSKTNKMMIKKLKACGNGEKASVNAGRVNMV